MRNKEFDYDVYIMFFITLYVKTGGGNLLKGARTLTALYILG